MVLDRRAVECRHDRNGLRSYGPLDCQGSHCAGQSLTAQSHHDYRVPSHRVLNRRVLNRRALNQSDHHRSLESQTCRRTLRARDRMSLSAHRGDLMNVQRP